MPNANKAKTRLARSFAKREVVIAAMIFALSVSAIMVSQLRPPSVVIEGTRIAVDVADDLEERQLGLSGRDSLKNNTGMLFIFEEPGLYGFWMKDMKFDIDMIWLDKKGTVVHLEAAVPADSYPQIYYPSVPASYVLELNSGESEQLGLDIGDIVNLEL